MSWHSIAAAQSLRAEGVIVAKMRSFSSLVTLAALAVVGSASPLTSTARSDHVVHERRSAPPPGWQARERVEGHVKMPLRIGLKQRNLDMGAYYLDEVSNPHSSKYGQHWSADDVISMFEPRCVALPSSSMYPPNRQYSPKTNTHIYSSESVESVSNWLTESGIAADRINQHANKGWVEVPDATVREIEDLLQTEYYLYDHKHGSSHVACDEYSVPQGLSADHIDIILPTIHFDARKQPSQEDALRKRRKRDSGLPSLVGNNTHSLPKPGKALSADELVTDAGDLTACDTEITPDCLRALYNFTTGTLNESSYGIVEYGFQSYLPADLDLFFGNFSTDLVGQRPKLDSVDGGEPQSLIQLFEFNGESDLDLQYSMVR